MTDVLKELAESIQKGENVFGGQRAQRVAPAPQPRDAMIRKGPGGVIFNFGSYGTGDPLIDGFSALLNHQAEPNQLATIKSQRAAYEGQLAEFVEKGEDRFNLERSESMFAHDEWSQQLSTSTDDQVKQAYERGALTGDANQTALPSGAVDPQGRFSKSEIRIGHESVTATSETDAAIIEMMKNGNLSLDDEAI